MSVIFEIGKRFAPLADAHNVLGRRFVEQLAAGMDATCHRLGIVPPPVPDVRDAAGDEAIRVRLNGRVRRCPEAIARAVSEHFLCDEPGPAFATPTW